MTDRDHDIGAAPDLPARRNFLRGASALLAGASLPAGFSLVQLAQAKPADEPVTDDVRWGMLIDASKCTRGCTDCVDACNTEHGLHDTGHPRTDAQWIRKVELRHKTTGWVGSLPMLCQHCETAPCVDVCPTGASFRRADGIVLVDKHTCIGCRYCMMACPYKARSFIHEPLTDQLPQTPRGKGTVESCNFCVNRVDAGITPACVEACSDGGHGALLFGDLKNPDSELARRLREEPSTEIRADLGLDTAVRYQGI